MNIRNSSDGKTHAFFLLDSLAPTFKPHTGYSGLQKMLTFKLVKTQHFACSDRIEFLGAKSNVIMGGITLVSAPEKSGLTRLEHHLTDDPRPSNDLIIRERHLARIFDSALRIITTAFAHAHPNAGVTLAFKHRQSWLTLSPSSTHG
jgi:hypothetical protein